VLSVHGGIKRVWGCEMGLVGGKDVMVVCIWGRWIDGYMWGFVGD